MRPEKLSEIIGNYLIKDRLRISIEAANIDKTSLGHCIFSGQPGLGKTTLALAVAKELGSRLITANGGNLRTVKDIIGLVNQLNFRDVLFIDEIHNIPVKSQESLFTVLEDYKLYIDNGNSTFHVDVPMFTMIGATTEEGMLSKPFRDRFVYKFVLQPYTTAEIAAIISKNAAQSCLTFEQNIVELLSVRCRGTPRLAINYLQWLKDYCKAKKIFRVNKQHIDDAMKMIGVDEQGLTIQDHNYLNFLLRNNNPVGVKTIAAGIGESVETIEQVIEPYLVSLGKISKCTKGRYLNGCV